MNNYLLQLLKEVKTIIIPGLGALTLTNEHTGEMMFMSYLKFDDGTLAKHIAEKEGIDINDAKNLIAKFVREVTAQLDKGESYDMYQFGTFRKADGETAFDQWEIGSVAAAPVEIAAVAPEIVPVAEEIIPADEEPAVEEEQKGPEPIENIAEAPVIAYEEENSIREELPVSESEAMGAAIAAAVTDNEPEEEPAAPVMEEVPEPEREEAITAIVPGEEPVPVVELTDEGFDIKDTPAPPAAEPVTVHESPLPVNDVPPVTKHEPGVGLSPKEIVEAKDAQQAKKKTAVPVQQKKKAGVLSYILWGLLVLLLGGGTYVAVNYDTLKKDFPALADLTGDEKEESAPAPSVEDTLIAEPDPAETTVEEPVSEEPAPEAEPVVEEPAPAPPVVEKPVTKPKPAVSSPRPRPVSPGNSTVKIGQPDPSKPYHVIGGSFGSEANAKRFARDLIAKGQPSVIVGEQNGMYRVSISSFATKDEAVAAHASLKSMVPGAWVFKWP